MGLYSFWPFHCKLEISVDQLNFYFIAIVIEGDAKQCAILLSNCGLPTFATICSLVNEETLASNMLSWSRCFIRIDDAELLW